VGLPRIFLEFAKFANTCCLDLVTAMHFNVSFKVSNRFSETGIGALFSFAMKAPFLSPYGGHGQAVGFRFSGATLARDASFLPFLLLPVLLHCLIKDVHNQSIHAHVALFLNRAFCRPYPYPFKKLFGKSNQPRFHNIRSFRLLCIHCKRNKGNVKGYFWGVSLSSRAVCQSRASSVAVAIFGTEVAAI
jgi:hypothetical protein